MATATAPPPASTAGAEPTPLEERVAKGKDARSRAPRSSHADWQPASGRPDPVALLEEQAESRVQELVPIRHGRMAVSPFAFFRGGAYIMAADLADTPSSGFRVQLCGDAHLSNFGGFASPERDLLFDLNDFDETLPGPWEWDVKRLAASLVVAGRQLGFPARDRRAIVRGATRRYRETVRSFCDSSALEVWYARLDADVIRELRPPRTKKETRQFQKVLSKAHSKDSMRAFRKLAREVDGAPRIVAQPPLIMPIEELFPGAEGHQVEDELRAMIEAYRATLPVERRKLVDRYRYAHLARKVVGVGSVGTRAWIILLIGQEAGDPLFLQAKEAQPSVLEPFAGKSQYRNQGRRVVEGQRLMQSASDILLGWLHTTGGDGEERDFYIRQLWDWKISADVDSQRPSEMADYSKLCAWTLARAHARSGDARAIGAYMGAGDSFDKAIAEFAERYADQNEIDYRAFLDAIDSGRIPVEKGL